MTIIPHLFMDYLLMFYNLGNQEAWQTGLDRKVRTPNVCSEPGAALRELKNWRSTVQRTVDTKLGLPDKSIMGPALISIFEGVFTSVVCNQALNHRYTNLLDKMDIPNDVTSTRSRTASSPTWCSLTAVLFAEDSLVGIAFD